MKTRLLLILLCGIAMLLGCSEIVSPATPSGIPYTSPTVPPTAPSLPHVTTISPSQTSIPTLTATITLRPPTLTPITTSTPIFLPQTKLRTNCLEILESLPDNAVLEGSLVLWRLGGYQETWFDLRSRELRPLTQEGYIATSFSVSSDGRWLGYVTGSPSTEYWLMLSRLNEQPIPILATENLHLLGWLDNERLVLVRYQEETYLDPLVVLNPFTGQQVELLPDYPNIDYLTMTTKWDTNRTVYDPTLTLVVYPRSGFNYSDITLWDISNNQPLAAVPGYVGRGAHPEWSPDGEFVSIIGRSPGSDPNDIDLELYLVSRDGVVIQATNLGEYYTDNLIWAHSWSPDGRYISFWLWTGPIDYDADPPPEQLMLLDTTTMESTNYCIFSPAGEMSGGPFWSPDGRWMAVHSQCGPGHEDCIVLVNVVDNYAVRIIDQWIVAGWMISP